MKQLDDLPPTNDTKFWAEADTHIVKPETKFFDRPHFLKRVAGHQAQCTHCDWGFQLDPGDYLVEGHLFDKTGKKVL